VLSPGWAGCSMTRVTKHWPRLCVDLLDGHAVLSCMGGCKRSGAFLERLMCIEAVSIMVDWPASWLTALSVGLQNSATDTCPTLQSRGPLLVAVQGVQRSIDRTATPWLSRLCG
jgi:hypothetical protein